MAWRHYIPKGPVSASPAGLSPQDLPQPGLSGSWKAPGALALLVGDWHHSRSVPYFWNVLLKRSDLCAGKKPECPWLGAGQYWGVERQGSGGQHLYSRAWRGWDGDVGERQAPPLHTEGSSSPEVASGSGIPHPHFPSPTRCCHFWSGDCTLRTTVLEQ